MVHVRAAVVVHYFVIDYFTAAPDGVPVTILGINNTVPSPTIELTQGDRLIVHLQNNAREGQSLHWHGLSQRTSPQMDGVVGVTQCALEPGGSMTYNMSIDDEAGTYWYHAHAGMSILGSRGIAGALIVKPKVGHNPHAHLYSSERLLLVQDWSHESPMSHYAYSQGGLHPPVAQSSNAHNVALYRWESGLMNGMNGMAPPGQSNDANELAYYTEVVVQHGQSTRLRIINMGENFALGISIDSHQLTIIGTDGIDTEPSLAVDEIILHVGERYDAVILTNQVPGSYWIRASTLERDIAGQVHEKHEIRGILRYAGRSTK